MFYPLCKKSEKALWGGGGGGGPPPPPRLYVRGLTCDQRYFREEVHARDTFISRDADRPRSHLNWLAQRV